MKKILLTIFLLLPSYALAAPLWTFSPTIIPISDNASDLGSSSPSRYWANLFIKGNITNPNMSDGCAKWLTGVLTTTGVACGAGGGGSGGGTWSTTTSNVANQFINYSNNNTDIVTIGGTSTSTAKFYFDPNIKLGQIQDRLKIGNNFVATTTTVCSYGCDYSDIDTAVDNVVASTTILIKNGTYALGTNTITVTGGKTLDIIGESREGVVITYSGGGAAFTVGDSSTITRNFRMENITIKGTSSGTRGFSFVNVRNSTFRNLYGYSFTSSGNPGQAFRLDGTGGYTGDNEFYDLRCDTSDYCINLSGTAVNANHFYGFTLRGTTRSISISNANGNTFEGGLVGSPAGTGVLLTATGDENYFDGIYCESDLTCVNLQAGANDNTIHLLNVETTTTVVTDSGSRNNVSFTGSDFAQTYFNGGNFGLGTTSPGSVLSIQGNQFIAGNIVSTSTSASIFPYATTTALSAGTICLTADICRTTWPTGGSGTGTGNVSTSSAENSGQIPYWTSNSATPALLSGGSSSFTFDGTKFVTTYASTTVVTVSQDIYLSNIAGSRVLVTGSNGIVQGNSSLPIALGGTFATSFSSGGVAFFDGTRLSSTNVAGQGLVFSGGNLGVGSSSPSSQYSISATKGIYVAGNSIFGGTITSTSTNGFSTFPYASTTALTVSTIASTTNLTVSSVLSALHLADSSGNVTAYGGTSCTNQFLRALSATGGSTCATVGAADVSLANLTATDGTLTFSGTYNGSTARTIGLNLGNNNVWTASTTFQLQTNMQQASTTNLTASNGLYGAYLGIPAGSFLATDPNGKIIATTSPAGTGTVTTLTAGTNVTFSSGATCTTTCTINSSGGSGTFSFTSGNAMGQVSNSTSTLMQFTAFPYSLAASSSAIIDGNLVLGGGAFNFASSTASTTISHLDAGNIVFPPDMGKINGLDFTQISAPANSEQSYSLNSNGSSTPNLTIFSRSDGSGGIFSQGVGIGTSTPWGDFAIVGQKVASTTMTFGDATHPGCITWPSTNGTVYRVYMSNAGALTTEAGACQGTK